MKNELEYRTRIQINKKQVQQTKQREDNKTRL